MQGSRPQYAQEYYDGNGQNGDRPALKLFTRLARHYLPAGRLVDFGCGPGFFLAHLARHFDASGVEISEWARRQARSRVGVPVAGSLEELADQSQDGIVSLHVVEHIPDPALREVLASWRRVLRSGGRALVVTPDASGFAHRCKGDRWIAFTDPTHINLKSHAQWAAMFKQAGFRVVKRFADGLWDFPYVLPWLGKAEVFLLGWPILLQFILARPLPRAGSGESVIFVLELDRSPAQTE